jgi:putative transposase
LKETGEAEKKEIPIVLILNAIFYVLKTGCQWRMLPRDFPKWKTVYHYFSFWNKKGIIEKVHNHLRGSLREAAGKDKDLSLGMVDSQCVKTSFMAREDKGFNGGKLVKGRKRNIFVDTLGLLWGLSISPANQSEIDGAIERLNRAPSQMPELMKILFDAGYKGAWFQRFIEGSFGCATEIVERLGKGFDVQAFRWIVERTFSWFEGFRRLSKDYEMKTTNSEAWIFLAMTKIMLNRLSP